MRNAIRLVRPLYLAWLCASATWLASAGCQNCKVVRVNSGRASCGREIDAAAYAAYARGQLAESSGDLRGALIEYQQVTTLDAQAAEAWVRIGAVQCRSDAKAAAEAWRKAGQLTPDLHLLWLERARCAIAHGELTQADAFARTALQLSPTNSEVTLLNARIASRLGDSEREATLLFGALAVEPHNAALWKAAMESPTLPTQYRVYATQRFLKLRPLGDAWVPPPYRDGHLTNVVQKQIEQHLGKQLQYALSRKDDGAALHYAALLGLRTDELALAALLAGFDSLAMTQANLILNIDPGDPSAWLIAVVAADVSLASEKYEQLLAHPPSNSGVLSPALVGALHELLGRRMRAALCSDPKQSDCNELSAGR